MHQDQGRDRQAERLGPKVEHKFETWKAAAQGVPTALHLLESARHNRPLAIRVAKACPITQEAAGNNVLAPWKHCRNPIAHCEPDDLLRRLLKNGSADTRRPPIRSSTMVANLVRRDVAVISDNLP